MIVSGGAFCNDKRSKSILNGICFNQILSGVSANAESFSRISDNARVVHSNDIQHYEKTVTKENENCHSNNEEKCRWECIVWFHAIKSNIIEHHTHTHTLGTHFAPFRTRSTKPFRILRIAEIFFVHTFTVCTGELCL